MRRNKPQGREDRIEQAVEDAIDRYGVVMTDREVQAFARVTPATTARWRNEGTGPPAQRLGERTLRYDTSEVVRWVLGGNIEADR